MSTEYLIKEEYRRVNINGKPVRIKKRESLEFENKREAVLYKRKMKRIKVINEYVAMIAIGSIMGFIILTIIGLGVTFPIILAFAVLIMCLMVDQWCS